MTFNRVRDRLDAVRHPEYFRFDRRGNRLPYNDHFKRVYIADEAALVAAFRTGQIDYMSPGTIDLLEDLLATNPNILVHVQPFWGTYQLYFVFQHKNPVWQDVRVRRALSMALDRKKVIDVVYRGAALFSRPVSYDFLGLDEPQRDEDLGPYMQYNPTEARRLLEEAGYRDGLDVELTTTSPPSDLYLLFQQMWAEVGVRLRFDLQESTVVNSKRNQKTFRDLIPNGNISAYELDAWATRQFLPESPQNWGSINDPVLNELIRKQHVSTDPDERTRIAWQISERELDQMNILWHVSPHVMHVRHPWIWNFSNHLHSSVDSRGKSVHQVMWLDERAPAGRAGRRAG
jgi:ABC-type transport system substrate-binding protein